MDFGCVLCGKVTVTGGKILDISYENQSIGR